MKKKIFPVCFLSLSARKGAAKDQYALFASRGLLSVCAGGKGPKAALLSRGDRARRIFLRPAPPVSFLAFQRNQLPVSALHIEKVCEHGLFPLHRLLDDGQVSPDIPHPGPRSAQREIYHALIVHQKGPLPFFTDEPGPCAVHRRHPPEPARREGPASTVSVSSS